MILNKKTINIISKYFLLFIMYSFLGFVYEIAYETFLEHWTFMPREFFRGPICPIYGIGGVILYIIFIKVMEDDKLNKFLKLIIVFLVTLVISSILEFILSYILEFTTGGWPWQSYKNYPLNFDGRISFHTSVKFGGLGVVFIYFMYNKINAFFEKMENKNLLSKLAFFIFVIFILDLIFAILIPTGVKLNVQRTKFI